MDRSNLVPLAVALTALGCARPTAKLVTEHRFDEVVCRAAAPEHVREAAEALVDAIDLRVRTAPVKMDDPELAELTERVDLIPIEPKVVSPPGTTVRISAIYAPDGLVVNFHELTRLTGETPLFERHTGGYFTVDVINLLVTVWSLGALRDRSTPILDYVPGKTIAPTQAARDAAAPIAAKLRRSALEHAPGSPWIVLERQAPRPPSKVVVNVTVSGTRCHARITLETPFAPGPDFVPVRRWQAIEGSSPGGRAQLLSY